jgi:hypothetical protein
MSRVTDSDFSLGVKGRGGARHANSYFLFVFTLIVIITGLRLKGTIFEHPYINPWSQTPTYCSLDIVLKQWMKKDRKICSVDPQAPAS